MKVIKSGQVKNYSHSNLLWASVLLISLALLVTLFSLDTKYFTIGQHNLGAYFEIATIILGTVLFVIIFIWSRSRGYFDPFDLPIWISINVYVQVIFGTFINKNFFVVIPWLSAADHILWGETVVLFGVGLLSMWLGYVLVYRYILNNQKNEKKADNRIFQPAVAYAVWGLGVLVSIFAMVTGTQGYMSTRSGFAWENYLAIIQFVAWAAWSGLLFHHLQKPTRSGWLWIVVSLGISIASGFVLGTKSVVLWFVYVIMHIFYLKRKISLSWIIVAIFLSILFIPIVNQTRKDLQSTNYGGGVSLERRLSVITNAGVDVLKNPLGFLFEQSFTTISNRQTNLFRISASVLNIHPSKSPYVGLDMGTNLISQVIPRLLWPNKPARSQSLYNITELYYGIRVQGLTAIGIFADSYRAGGWFFVSVFFSIFGGGLAWLYGQGPARGSAFGTVFYLTMLVWIILFERDISGLLIFTFEHGVIIYIFIKYILFKPQLMVSDK